MPREKGQKKSSSPSTKVKIVKIPCDDKQPYQELEIPVECDRAGDQLPEMLRVYFTNGVIQADSLKEATKTQFASQDIVLSSDMIQNASESGSVEVFPLAFANDTNKQCKVSFYLDEVGQLKKLPPNSRATALANMCGFKDVPFAGDMFVGRYGPNESGKFVNLDFTLAELDSSSAWLYDIQRLNYEHGVTTNRVAMAGGDDTQQEVLDEARKFRWSETEEGVEVGVQVPPQIEKFTSKDVKVTFHSKSLKVELKNTSAVEVASVGSSSSASDRKLVGPGGMITLLELQLAGAIRTDECAWTVNKRELEISMEKVYSKHWGKLENLEN